MLQILSVTKPRNVVIFFEERKNTFEASVVSEKTKEEEIIFEEVAKTLRQKALEMRATFLKNHLLHTKCVSIIKYHFLTAKVLLMTDFSVKGLVGRTILDNVGVNNIGPTTKKIVRQNEIRRCSYLRNPTVRALPTEIVSKVL